MKNVCKCFCLLFLLTSFAQIDAKEEKAPSEDFSKMSAKELDKAFVVAIEKGRSDEVKKLIEAGANINQGITYTKYDNDFDYDVTYTPLVYAAERGHIDVIKVLIQENPKIDDVNGALFSAAENGYVNIVKELLKIPGINRNYEGRIGDTALIIAIKNACLSVVEELMQAEFDVNYVNKYGETPLLIAVDYARPLSEFSKQAQERYKSHWEDRAKIIQTLLNARANVNHADRNGNTALILAIKKHDFNTVEKILKIPEINVNHVNNDGDTAIIIAIKYMQYSYVVGDSQQYHSCMNSKDILEKLIETPGIDFYHSNKNGDTAVDLLLKLSDKMQQ